MYRPCWYDHRSRGYTNGNCSERQAKWKISKWQWTRHSSLDMGTRGVKHLVQRTSMEMQFQHASVSGLLVYPAQVTNGHQQTHCRQEHSTAERQIINEHYSIIDQQTYVRGAAFVIRTWEFPPSSLSSEISYLLWCSWFFSFASDNAKRV